MTWKPTAEAAALLGISPRTLERRIAAEALPSYLADDGRRLVWVAAESGEALARLEDEVRQLRAAVERLTEAAGRQGLRTDLEPDFPARVPESPDVPAIGPTHRRPTLARPAATHDISRAALLELIGEVWTGSESELERRAGVSKAWIYKARRRERAGKPESIKGRASRLALLAVLEAEQKADTSAQPSAPDSIAA